MAAELLYIKQQLNLKHSENRVESDPIKSEKIRSKKWDNVPFFLTRIIWDSRQIKCGMKDFGEKSPAFITNEYRHCASIKSLLRTNSLHRKKTEKTSQSRATNNEKQSKILPHQNSFFVKAMKNNCTVTDRVKAGWPGSLHPEMMSNIYEWLQFFKGQTLLTHAHKIWLSSSSSEETTGRLPSRGCVLL